MFQQATTSTAAEGRVSPPNTQNPKYLITRNPFMRNFLKQLDCYARLVLPFEKTMSYRSAYFASDQILPICLCFTPFRYYPKEPVDSL